MNKIDKKLKYLIKNNTIRIIFSIRSNDMQCLPALCSGTSQQRSQTSKPSSIMQWMMSFKGTSQQKSQASKYSSKTKEFDPKILNSDVVGNITSFLSAKETNDLKLTCKYFNGLNLVRPKMLGIQSIEGQLLSNDECKDLILSKPDLLREIYENEPEIFKNIASRCTWRGLYKAVSEQSKVKKFNVFTNTCSFAVKDNQGNGHFFGELNDFFLDSFNDYVKDNEGDKLLIHPDICERSDNVCWDAVSLKASKGFRFAKNKIARIGFNKSICVKISRCSKDVNRYLNVGFDEVYSNDVSFFGVDNKGITLFWGKEDLERYKVSLANNRKVIKVIPLKIGYAFLTSHGSMHIISHMFEGRLICFAKNNDFRDSLKMTELKNHSDTNEIAFEDIHFFNKSQSINQGTLVAIGTNRCLYYTRILEAKVWDGWGIPQYHTKYSQLKIEGNPINNIKRLIAHKNMLAICRGEQSNDLIINDSFNVVHEFENRKIEAIQAAVGHDFILFEDGTIDIVSGQLNEFKIFPPLDHGAQIKGIQEIIGNEVALALVSKTKDLYFLSNDRLLLDYFNHIEKEKFQNVAEVTSSSHAFAVVYEDSSMMTFGLPSHGGYMNGLNIKVSKISIM